MEKEILELLKLATTGERGVAEAAYKLSQTPEGQEALMKLMSAQKMYGNASRIYPAGMNKVGVANREIADVLHGNFNTDYYYSPPITSMYNLDKDYSVLRIAPYGQTGYFDQRYIPVGVSAGEISPNIFQSSIFGRSQPYFYNGKKMYGAVYPEGSTTSLDDIVRKWTVSGRPYTSLYIPRVSMYNPRIGYDQIPRATDVQVFSPNANLFYGTKGGDTTYDFIKYMADKYNVELPADFGEKALVHPYGTISW